MTDAHKGSTAAEVVAVRAGLGARNPKLATAADVEAAIFRIHGLGALSDSLWIDGAAVSAEARKSVRRHVHARFGARSPRTGALTIIVFLLLLGVTAPLALLNSLRQGATGVEPAAAAVTALLGFGVLLVVALAGAKPFGRATLLQVSGLAVLLGLAGGWGAVMTAGTTQALFIAGAAAAVLAVLIVIVVRWRNRAATNDIDNALEIAHVDVAPEVRQERQRMMGELERAMTGRSDLAAMRRVRTAVIDDLRGLGNPLTDSDPASLPGTYLIEGQTNAWIPAPIARARPAGLGG